MSRYPWRLLTNVPDLIELMYQHHGNVVKVAEERGLSTAQVRDAIKKEKEVREAYEDARSCWANDRMDTAEEALEIMVKMLKKNPGISYKAATYILDNLGGERGFTRSSNTTDDRQSKLGSKVDELDTNITVRRREID